MAKGSGSAGGVSSRVPRAGTLAFVGRDDRYMMSTRVLGSTRTTVTLQYVQGYGKVGRTDTVSRRGLVFRPMNESERAIHG